MSTKCITPFHVMDKLKNEKVPVPCGRCPPCKARRTSSWSFRLTQEGRRANSALFVTLTYNTDHVPITANGFMNLKKRDVQLFMKRLRKITPIEMGKVTYYLAGEYGGKSFRPHYHAIVFNARVEDIEMSWKLGSIHYGEVNGASIGYTLKYMCKTSRIPMHCNDDREKEFSLMSKGIGSNYLTEAIKAYHKADLENRMVITLKDGKKITMPRYFKDKLYTEEERKVIAFFVKQKSEKLELDYEFLMFKQFGSDWRRVEAAAHKASFEKMERDALKRSKI